MRLEGWEDFNQPVDRIVSIGAFEHFGRDRWDDFFTKAYDVLPEDGVMLLHTITALTIPQMAERKIPLTFSVARFIKFILTEIFPGGYLPTIELAQEHAQKAGFTVTRTQSLQPHYAKTLDHWAAALEEHKDRPSPSSPKRSTTGTCTTSPAARMRSARVTPMFANSRWRRRRRSRVLHLHNAMVRASCGCPGRVARRAG